MTKSKAIKNLNDQINKLKNDNSYEYDDWLRQTKTLIKEIFGVVSEEFRFINTFGFSYYPTTMPVDNDRIISIRKQIDTIIKYLITCIDTIKQVGVKTENKNFLSNYKTPELVGYLTTIGILLFSIGYYFGYDKGENQNIEIRQELKVCRDSLNTINTTFNIPDNKPKNNSNRKK